LSGRFDYRLKLPAAPAGEALIVHFEVVLYTAIDDHRPLGVLLAAAAVLLPTSATRSSAPDAALDISRVDLTEIHEDELRVSRLEEWMRALRDTAATRPAAMEEAFAQLRGPHSAALQSWLEAHAGDYDTILVQGIPFDLIPRTMETLSRLPQRPRVVALPHFHGDDRFYHWRRYAQALAAADATLLFSTSIAQALDPAIKAIVVPGGGVRPEEHADLEAEPSFRRIHNRVEPYFLVLGRKVGSKGYDRVILAHQRLRREGLRIGLVLVGPDEDKLAVSGEGVYALGQQPRGVVIGAVRGCLGVVTMSHSESFGIVLCEAWLFGKPVIANAACYAFRERVAHGSNGLLVTTDDELVAAMRTLAEDPDERHRLGASGFREVLSTFTWENVAEAVFKAIVPHTRDASPTPSRATPRVALELAPEDTLAP
jgi:glycosyltransferase involved in cell wall biosynthesis